MKFTLLASFCLFCLLITSQSIKVQQWVTRTDDDEKTLFTRWADLDLAQETGAAKKKIEIKFDTSEPKNFMQNMQGFGCALTESSGAVLLALRNSDYFKYIRTLLDLFGPDGIKLNMLRIPISSSDFSVDEYSLNDLPEHDTNLSGFTMEKLNRYVIPVLRDIMQINQDIQLMLSPWTGPAWIKDNPSLHWGTLRNDYIDTWALYLFKSIEAIESAVGKETVKFITMQNQPLHDPCDYACMRMSTEQQAQVSKSLKNLMDKAGKTTKILVFDHNWDDYWYPIEVFTYLGVKEAAAGAAFHCYGGEVKQQHLFYEATRKEIHLTECSGGDWSPDFKNNVNWVVGTLGIEGTQYRSGSLLLWNLALDQYHGPHVGGCQNCRAFVTTTRPGWDDGKIPQAVDSVQYQVQYYSIAHFSKFIDDSFVRVDTQVDD